MSNKITNFTELTAASIAAADVLPVVDISATTSGSKKMKAAALAQAASVLKYFADTGGDDAYVVTTGLSLSALTAGMVFAVKATTANTGAATLAVDSVGAVTIVKHGADTLVSGDIAAGMVFEVRYDGTNFQLLNPKVSASRFILGAFHRSLSGNSYGRPHSDVNYSTSASVGKYYLPAGTYRIIELVVWGQVGSVGATVNAAVAVYKDGVATGMATSIQPTYNDGGAVARENTVANYVTITVSNYIYWLITLTNISGSGVAMDVGVDLVLEKIG